MKISITAFVLILVAVSSLPVDAEIHRCIDADGNMVFSQFPCAAEPAAAKDDQDDELPAVEVEDETESTDATIDVVTGSREAQTVAQCKKPYRDAIDAIEARMLNGYTPEQGAAYKKQLLGLTRGLRACES